MNNSYDLARDAAWRLLLESGTAVLPVKISVICRMLGIKIIPYSNLGGSPLEGFTHGCDGFSLSLSDRLCIFYDDKVSFARTRFTLAHELGHCVLHYVGKTALCRRTRELCRITPAEKEANAFASALLAPLIVLHDCGVTESSQIVRMCGISASAAEASMKRLSYLYGRESKFISEHGRSFFGMLPLEQALRERFSDYIANNRS